MQPIRPAGAGRPATVEAFLRTIASPRAGLVFVVDLAGPDDWPGSVTEAEANLGHAAGWTCEVRRSDVVLLDPLGEGVAKAPLPELSTAWLENVAHDASCAVYLAPPSAASDFAELTIAAAAATGTLRAATVRTAVAPDHGRLPEVGRNQPCPCGSGKKYKHCHG